MTNDRVRAERAAIVRLTEDGMVEITMHTEPDGSRWVYRYHHDDAWALAADILAVVNRGPMPTVTA